LFYRIGEAMEIPNDGLIEIKPMAAPQSEDKSSKFDKWWALVIVVVGLIVFLASTKPDPYLRILLYVRDGIWNTVFTTVSSFFLVLIIGLIIGLGRLSKNIVSHSVTTIYVEIIRGIPILVQLFFWYFAFPPIVKSIGEKLNIELLKNFLADPYGMAILGLTFCYAAYMAEIYRAGIQSVAKGQMEAARSLGMSHIEAMRYIVLPQAVRIILPPVGNEFISLLKDSSLISVVALNDITRRGREFMATNFIPIETWTMVALLYLTMTLFSARIVTWIERNTRLER
jgi:polar amino acid transport system permease protein